MVAVLAYALTLLVAVLFSDVARRTAFSTTALFLVVGMVAGASGWMRVAPGDPLIHDLAELALVCVLFTDGAKLGLAELRSAWRLAGRALLLAMPLTLVAIAAAGWWFLDLDWREALLLGAVLSPTDPVFASALLEAESVPRAVRRLLNVESGLNDGLALPAVVVLLGTLRPQPRGVGALLGEVALGLGIGALLPLAAVGVGRLLRRSATALYQRLFPVAIGLAAYALARLLGGNEFLALFAAGATLATAAPEASERFAELGDSLAELVKLAALLVLGAAAPRLLVAAGWQAWLFAALVIALARPLAILFSLLGTPLPREERWTVAWFGPKGFASVVFGLLVLRSGIPGAGVLGEAIAVTVVVSILLHSTTDVPIAHWFERAGGGADAEPAPERAG